MEGSSSARMYSSIAMGAFVVGAVSQYLFQQIMAAWKERNSKRKATVTPLLTKAEVSRRETNPQRIVLTSFSRQQVIELRKTHFSLANSVSYANTGPLMIVKVRGRLAVVETISLKSIRVVDRA